MSIFSQIQKYRDRSHHERQRIAFFGALVPTLVIASVWGFYSYRVLMHETKTFVSKDITVASPLKALQENLHQGINALSPNSVAGEGRAMQVIPVSDDTSATTSDTAHEHVF